MMDKNEFKKVGQGRAKRLELWPLRPNMPKPVRQEERKMEITEKTYEPYLWGWKKSDTCQYFRVRILVQPPMKSNELVLWLYDPNYGDIAELAKAPDSIFWSLPLEIDCHDRSSLFWQLLSVLGETDEPLSVQHPSKLNGREIGVVFVCDEESKWHINSFFPVELPIVELPSINWRGDMSLVGKDEGGEKCGGCFAYND